MKRHSFEERRSFLKDGIRKEFDFSKTDQHRGLASPPITKAAPEGHPRIDLVPVGQWRTVTPIDVASAIAGRRSHRRYAALPLALDEVSFLLWATQGIQKVTHPGTAFRTVPSAGCRHAFETYLCVTHVDGLEKGVYRYLPLENQLGLVRREDDLPRKLAAGTLGQTFVARAPLCFVWTAIPYRMEWRYGPAAHKVVAIDAGHVCQNLYLACAAVGSGTCAVAAYDQVLMDSLLDVDGKEEFTVYLAPVGKVKRG